MQLNSLITGPYWSFVLKSQEDYQQIVQNIPYKFQYLNKRRYELWSCGLWGYVVREVVTKTSEQYSASFFSK